jgi:hypothetical protein
MSLSVGSNGGTQTPNDHNAPVSSGPENLVLRQLDLITKQLKMLQATR